MNRHRALSLLLCVAALSACEKNGVQELTGVAPGAAVKFYNFGLNAPAVNFYADDRKMTAINSTTGTESTNGTAYGGVSAGGFYTGLAQGQYTLSGRIAAATDKDLAISNTAVTLEDNKYYSYYLSGPYDATAKRVDAFIVEDPFITERDFSVANVRFVHAMYNASPMTLYARHTVSGTESAVGGEVAYKAAGAFVSLPGGIYDLNTRYAGSATNVITRTGVSFNAGNIYTVSARGDITVTSTTATNRPFLDNTANR
jgi:hypothetical protein